MQTFRIEFAFTRCSTKWNSTYLILESAEKFERAFDRMVIDDDQYMDYFEKPNRNGKKSKGPDC